MTTTKRRRFELRTDEATDQLISEAADLLHVTKSAFVADAARRHVARDHDFMQLQRGFARRRAGQR